ncbi:MAG: AMP-binding protein [Thermodesulfobacteriota bacterium]
MDSAPERRKADFMPVEVRTQRQLELLQASLNRACKTVDYYARKFTAACVSPGDVAGLSDLSRLPFTVRRDLAEHYPYGLFAVPLRDIVRIHTAPGMGANPTVTGYTKNDLLSWREITARALSAAGLTANDIVQIFLDPGLANWGRDYKDGAEFLEASVIPLTALAMEKQISVLRDYRVTALITCASLAERMLSALRASGAGPDLALKTLILVGEPVPPEDRARLSGENGLSTWIHYGLSEVPGPAIAFECPAHQGMHLAEDHFYAEVVDPETGEPVKAGDPGELCLTTLTTRAFPLVRFRTGDRVREVPGACSCGRTFKRIEWLSGRTDHSVILRGVKVSREQVFFHMERALGFLPKGLRLAKGRQADDDGLVVLVGVDDDLFSDEIKELESVMRKAAAVLRQELGIPVKVRLTEAMEENRDDPWIAET